VQPQEETQQTFLEWIDAARSHQASYRDRCFTGASGKEFPTAYLMGVAAGSSDALPSAQRWIVSDYPEFIGRNALPTYHNAVRVVRAQRRQ
jgi:hypothetical protein